MSGGGAFGDTQLEDDFRRSTAANPRFATAYGRLAVVLFADQASLPEAPSFARFQPDAKGHNGTIEMLEILDSEDK